MTRRQERKRTRVDDPQVLDPVHPRLRIDHRTGVVPPPHLARTRRMPHRHEVVPDDFENLLVCRDLRARVVLLPDDHGLHTIAREGIAHTLECGDGDLHICLTGQPVGVDERWVRDRG